jgi:hypothetical protein
MATTTPALDSTNTAVAYLKVLTPTDLIHMKRQLLYLVLDHLIITSQGAEALRKFESDDERTAHWHRFYVAAEAFFLRTQRDNGNIAKLQAMSADELAPMDPVVHDTLFTIYE